MKWTQLCSLAKYTQIHCFSKCYTSPLLPKIPNYAWCMQEDGGIGRYFVGTQGSYSLC
jgi:hypothetical protein